MATGSTSPYWTDAGTPAPFPVLDAPRRADVVVVGGGITGITAAYLLARAGRSVVLLERGRLLERDTAHTTAHVTCVTDTRLTALVRTLGRDHATAVWDAGLAALAAIDDHVRTEALDCDLAWVPGYLHLAPGDEDVEGLRGEASLAAELGFDAEFVERDPLTGAPAMRVADQARIHPLKYLTGLVRAAVRHGAAIFEQSAVDEITDEPLGVVANGARVDCGFVVVATHNPPGFVGGVARATLLQTRLALYTSYVVGGTVSRGSVPDALFWDTADPYRYLRLTPSAGGDFVVYGGFDHKTGQEADTAGCLDALETALSAVVPGVSVTHRWSGQVIETGDGLPHIGEIAPRQFVATGFAGNGMTFGTLGAMMAVDAALGQRNPWCELFAVDRTNLRAGLWNYVTENKDYPYYMIRDRFAGAAARSLRAVPRGEGRVVEVNGARVAAYRAPDGSVTLRSAVCTHMACLVAWNGADRTWDCPCHGSRFTPDGQVIAGPATTPLEPVALATVPQGDR